MLSISINLAFFSTAPRDLGGVDKKTLYRVHGQLRGVMKRELIKGTTSGQADWRRRQTCLITILNSLITFTFLQQHFYFLAISIKPSVFSLNVLLNTFLTSLTFEVVIFFWWRGGPSANTDQKLKVAQKENQRNLKYPQEWWYSLQAKLLNTCSLTIMVGATNLIFLCWSAPVHHQSITCTGITKHFR